MTPKDLHRTEIASRILSGLVSNNAIIAPNDRCGFAPVNINERELVSMAIGLADELIKLVSE
jgi:hypothetical protein